MADFHVGHIIKAVFDEQGRTVKWFAEKMHCNRTNIYKMFEKSDLNSEIIARASKVLDHDFFLDISNRMKE
jgi:plasmid maintenance system antidote protein VapI